MDREEWIARCAAQYSLRAHMKPAQAYLAAVACYENNEDGDGPEFMADEDMACWDNDAA